MSASLATIASTLEIYAGASTTANPNESGYWKRIAVAAETLSGASTTANEHALGYMKRTALALESIAGTDGDAANPNESGYMKRIVDALEVQAGAVTTGSLMGRLVVAAENASFVTDPYGPNLVENSTFAGDDATGWTLSRVTISGEKLNMVNATGFAGSATYLVGPGLEDGVSYLVEFDVSDFVTAGGVSRAIRVGGASASWLSTSITNGHHQFTIAAGVNTETLQIVSNNNDNYKIDNVSLRKVL